MCWTGCTKGSEQDLTVGGVKQHYEGYYFCPHKGMTLGFSISISVLVIALLVTVLTCIRIEKIKCK